ncbi:MAG: anaerobic ribonucleoside-triphosphate reductase activating protein [Eubacteriales bacterium]|nr:anaerobic ribonucleoside-triphosphate reductase activating protein [Eubacteriales bacterium]
MYYGNIKNCDIADGEGVRVTIFVSGCTHHCYNCFQPETWNFSYGEEYTAETEKRILEMLAPSYIDGLTLLGGEPFEPGNQRVLLGLLKKAKAMYPEKTVWCYTGYTLEPDLLELPGTTPYGGRKNADGSVLTRARCEATDEMLSYIDILVDGEYTDEKRNISLAFRGSENQRIIDVKETLLSGSTVVLDKDRKR